MSKKLYFIIKGSISTVLGLFLSKKTLSFLCSPDKHIRYAEIIKLINRFQKDHPEISILDVGGGDKGLCDFLSDNKIKITILDISDKELSPARKKGSQTVLADASEKIPFDKDSFDIVTSVASLEHVPSAKRRKYCEELKRVAKEHVFMYVPSGEIARKYDKKLYRFSKSLGLPDPWTKEHIKYGLPSHTDLKNYFFGAKIYWIQNARVWHITMLLIKVPFVNLILPGLIYSVVLRWFDKYKPFIGAIVIWSKKK